MIKTNEAAVAVFQPQDMSCRISLDVLLEKVNRAIWSGATIILLDCSEIAHLDSMALGGLMTLHHHICAIGRQFYLCSVCEQAQHLLELTGTSTLFHIFEDRLAFDLFIGQKYPDS